MTRTEIYRNIAFENGKRFPWLPDEYKYYMYNSALKLDLSVSNSLKRATIETTILDNLIIEVNDYELLVGRMANSFVLDEEKEKVINDGWALECKLGNNCGWNNSCTNHRTVDYDKILKYGIKSIIAEIDGYIETAEDKDFYKASKMSLEAVCRLAKRYREFLLSKAEETEGERKEELLKMAENFEKAPYEPCTHFYEAMQCVWFVQFCLKAVDDISITGRPDNYLYPYYEKDIGSGYITKEFAFELIEQFFYKHNEIYDSWPCALMIGGVDKDGNTVCNDLTYMMVDAIRTTKLVNPSVSIAYTEDMPDELLSKAMECIAEGYTRPAIFNDRVIQKGLRDAGVSEKDARYYVHSACVEITPIASSDILVATPYVNLTRVFEYILSQKTMPYKIGKIENLKVGWGGWGVHTLSEDIEVNLESIKTFDEFYALTKKVLSSTLKAHMESAYDLVEQRAKGRTSPLSSALLDDCLKRGKDCGNGGVKYDFIYPCFIGFVNLADGITAIKKAVFEDKKVTLKELGKECQENFQNEELRQYLLNSCPKFGNDNDYADEIAVDLYNFIYNELQKLSEKGKRKIYPSYFAWKAHGIMGNETIATPDGRKKGEALSEHLGAMQGRDANGPTAVINSISKMDQSLGIGGIATNFKFSKNFMQSPKGKAAVKIMIEVFMESDCFELQFNVIGKDDLVKAQQNPEAYQTLMVRVAGFSDYFVRLSKNVQEEIIKRTEHGDI